MKRNLPNEPPDTIFPSYVALANGLVADLGGIGMLDEAINPTHQSGRLPITAFAEWVKSLRWTEVLQRMPSARAGEALDWWVAIPLQDTRGLLLGVFCVIQRQPRPPTQPTRFAADLAQRLKPLLDCVHRDLAAAVPARGKLKDLTERTAELEWLFSVTSNLKGAVDDQKIIQELLSASTERLHCVLGILHIPDKHLTVKFEADRAAALKLWPAWTQMQSHLLSWVQRRKRPLLSNGAGSSSTKIIRCKVLCVPVVRESGPVVGALTFYNPPEAPDFLQRHAFLAQHIGRQAASIVEAQFDLMTGLYTRSGLDQMYTGLDEMSETVESSIIYLDIDHMHIANELHGFELGNELIVRVADLLSAPLLPEGALAARISGDRFAVVLPGILPADAVHMVKELQAAVARLVIGPAKEVVDISLSCGVASLLAMPDGLARAIAAAELACKTAKNRGRNRVELYAVEDGSMMRRHRDAIAVGELRAALKADRMILYAQRIAPLQNPSLPGGYEILLRLQQTDGTLVAPGTFIDAAQRYQILPSIDRWVVRRALQMLGPHRAMLRSRGLGISINVSGQSISDEAFITQFCRWLKEANLPKGCISVELTEQAAVGSLARATDAILQFKSLGCEFALDDFGTGANSLTYLKSLAVGRVKIDGSFVRDILTDRNSKATVRAIVELARGLAIQTVAEYVENEAIRVEVRKLGVDYAQGYHVGKPEPLDELLESLTRDESQRLHRLFLET
jgi:diguanylate cyclase (GGDEF)-like protein